MSIASYQIFHKKNLGVLIFPFLSKKDRENLGQVDKTWKFAKLRFGVQGYTALMDRIRQKNSIYVNDATGLHQETILGVLGCGGSKQAIALQAGRALMLPNVGFDSIYDIAERWKRMVHEEVAMSQLLTKLGLLSPLSRRVSVSLSSDPHEEPIPAFLSETFENLKETKGWFVIDKKNPDSSTWKQGKNLLFNSEEDRCKTKNWDSIVDSLLTDIAKICMYKIPLHVDSLNVAIVKKSSESTTSQYEIRYFGFDFSSKYGRLSIPKIQNIPFTPNPSGATCLLNHILDSVFSCEFGQSYDFSIALRHARERLAVKYSNDIASRMQSQCLADIPLQAKSH